MRAFFWSVMDLHRAMPLKKTWCPPSLPMQGLGSGVSFAGLLHAVTLLRVHMLICVSVSEKQFPCNWWLPLVLSLTIPPLDLTIYLSILRYWWQNCYVPDFIQIYDFIPLEWIGSEMLIIIWPCLISFVR